MFNDTSFEIRFHRPAKWEEGELDVRADVVSMPSGKHAGRFFFHRSGECTGAEGFPAEVGARYQKSALNPAIASINVKMSALIL